jgi:hypothetical protein
MNIVLQEVNPSNEYQLSREINLHSYMRTILQFNKIKSFYTHFLRRNASESTQVSWSSLIWYKFTPPSNSFAVWRCLHNKMATDENLIKRGCIMVSICVPLSVKLLNPFSLISTLSFCVEIMALARRVVRCDICFGHNPGYFLKVIHTFHTIWMAWNDIRFNNSIITVHAAKAKIHSSVSTSAG